MNYTALRTEETHLYLRELDVGLHERQLQQLLSGRQQNAVVFVHEQLVEVCVMSRTDTGKHARTHTPQSNGYF